MKEETHEIVLLKFDFEYCKYARSAIKRILGYSDSMINHIYEQVTNDEHHYSTLFVGDFDGCKETARKLMRANIPVCFVEIGDKKPINVF